MTQHDLYIKNKTLLFDQYNYKSNSINKTQLAMQNSNITNEQLILLQGQRKEAFNDLDYYQDYWHESINKNFIPPSFDFSSNKLLLKDFDSVIRIANGGGRTTYAFAYNPSTDETSQYILGYEDSLKKFIRTFHMLNQDLTNNKSKSDSLIKKLSHIINYSYDQLPIVADTKNIKNLLLITEGSLSEFPFGLLYFMDQKTNKMVHLNEFTNITYSPSINAYIALKNRSKNKMSGRALLVSSNPESTNISNYVENLFTLRSSYGDIKFVDDEIDNISNSFLQKKFFSKKFDVKKIKSTNVSEKTIKNLNLSSYDYLHFATHGVLDENDPRYSGILLGRNENDVDDGIFQFHEVFPLLLNADLVTLSSCFSGFGEIDLNEGTLGFYRSFLVAGARSVIVSQWPVEDKSTSMLFSQFYKYLQEGKSKSESLRLAKMYLKNETEFSQPFFWAPFILIGES